MRTITMIGLDLAKNTFHVHAVDDRGKAVFSKKLARTHAIIFFSSHPPCIVAMEACSGAHFWGNKLRELGHEPRLISPQYVKPFVKRNKNDAADAEAICEAASRPNMHFVPLKSREQLNIQAIHRIRERLVGARTSLVNQVRGFLAEAGFVIPQGIHKLRKYLLELISNPENGLDPFLRDYISDLSTELIDLDEKIAKQDKTIMKISLKSEDCRRLRDIPGIGHITATAMIAAVGDATSFKNGRQLSAWVGLTPKQHSTGGKATLRGISKRGDPYLRKLLIHGARSVLHYSNKKKDRVSLWLQELQNRRGKHKAMVALANKTARIVWAVLVKQEKYRLAA